MAVEQGTATFYCQHLSCDYVVWRVNGVADNNIHSPNISTDKMQGNGGNIYYLSIIIGTLLEFNQAKVECVATFLNGTQPQFTPAVTLLIQGLMNLLVQCGV